MKSHFVKKHAQSARATLNTALFSIALAGALLLNGPSFAQYAQTQYKAPPPSPPQADRQDPAAVPAPSPVPAPSAVSPSASDWRAARLIGATMTDTLGNSIGTVQDIVIDGDGKVVAVLVSVGGFLGLGETTVAIGLRHLTISSFDEEHLDVKTSLSREAIEQAARLDAETPPVP